MSWSEVSADERTVVLDQAMALSAAAQRLAFDVISAAAEAEDFVADGSSDMVSWLVARYGMARSTARQWVEMADKLKVLPAISEAFGSGRLGWDRTRSLTRFATAESDAELAEQAAMRSAATVGAWAREQHKLTKADSQRVHATRSLQFWWDQRDRSLRLSGRFAEDDGARMIKALDRIADGYPKNPETGLFDAVDARRADALVELASQRLRDDADPDRATVVIHAPVEALTDEGVAELESGVLVGSETLRRLACDCRAQMAVHNPAGVPVGIGRLSRTIPHWLARQVRRRDRGCRFPGCGRTRWVHVHHLEHWSRGGATDLDNLILLCPFHHRLVHECGWTIEGDPNGEIVFRRPDGRSYPVDPAPLAEDWWDRFLISLHTYTRQAGTDPPDTS